MIPLILASSLFTSPQFCAELKYETDRAVSRGQLTKQQSDELFERCLDTYTKGA